MQIDLGGDFDSQGKVSTEEREDLVQELRRELGLGGGGGGRGKSLQVIFVLFHFQMMLQFDEILGPAGKDEATTPSSATSLSKPWRDQGGEEGGRFGEKGEKGRTRRGKREENVRGGNGDPAQRGVELKYLVFYIFAPRQVLIPRQC